MLQAVVDVGLPASRLGAGVRLRDLGEDTRKLRPIVVRHRTGAVDL
ncbi:MAG: hypothetical protein QOG25_65, partial [Acetobacteraceae bacterium]|nr:hypothetical protein [Acetobacteraceae bacterium]